MSDPQSANVGVYLPLLNSDVGSWNQPCNANFSVIDSLASNVATMGLTNVPVSLTVPPNSGASWSGPYQSQSALIRLTGTITANIVLTIPRAGFFIVENLCTPTGYYYVQLVSSGGGNAIGAPPGQKTHIFNDGTNMDFVDLPPVGSYLDLAYSGGDSGLPAWITACTVPPYLNCNGSPFSAITYPQLAALLGGTTLPDLRGRVRASFNQGTGRISASGVNGDTFLAAGGEDTTTIASQANLPSANFNISGYVNNTSSFNYQNVNPGSIWNPGSTGIALVAASKTAVLGQVGAVFTVGGVAASGGSSTPLATIPPVQIAGVTLIRAG